MKKEKQDANYVLWVNIKMNKEKQDANYVLWVNIKMNKVNPLVKVAGQELIKINKEKQAV